MKCKKLISHISGNHRVINYIEEKATQIVFHLDSFTSFDRNSKDNRYLCCQVSPRFPGQIAKTISSKFRKILHSLVGIL